MDIGWTEEYTKNTVAGFVWLVFFVVAMIGFFVGRDLARSEFAFKQVDALASGLNFFYQDNDRYPSEQEFRNLELMNQYFSGLPLSSIVSKKCPKPIAYRTFDRLDYTVEFCLPRLYAGLLAGSYSISKTDILPKY